ncbi:MAG: GIY-YIG nuclease family protein [Lactobacillales bacterium]|jgi:putative endonuclease|nr:GIY-YIG nuclease family protein [Lactobacillales bacterium]
MSDEFYFYVLKCADETLYGGFTTDLEHRLQTHNEGKGAKYTKARRPVEMIFARKYPTKSEALKQEYYFKHKLTRAQKFNYIQENADENIMKKSAK